MKWGVRRPRGADGHVTDGGGGHSTSSDAERAKEHADRAKTHGLHSLSNSELQHLVNRMNLEQNYARLTAPQKNKGSKFVTDLLLNVGKQQAAKLASDAASKALTEVMKKK
jgi:hypothetical protein